MSPTMRAVPIVPFVLVVSAACSRSPVEASDSGTDAGAETAAVLAADAGDSSAGLWPGAVAPPGPMVLLKGGTFRMGTDAWGSSAMAPAHMVSVSSFRLDITEVTVPAYRACIRAGACSAPDRSSLFWQKPDERDHPLKWPVDCVTWYQARDYCAWAGKELPTEEQWEYACAGPKNRPYPWGWSPYSATFSPPPNSRTPEGIEDLKRGRYEWTASFDCAYGDPACGADAGPETFRVVRGGEGVDPGPEALCAWRPAVHPTHVTSGGHTFRCAQRVDEPPPPVTPIPAKPAPRADAGLADRPEYRMGF
jgi:formylglycine-generating enzyme